MIGAENVSAGWWNRLVEAIKKWKSGRQPEEAKEEEKRIRIPQPPGGLESYIRERGGYKDGQPDPDWLAKEILRISRIPPKEREPSENHILPQLRDFFMAEFPDRIEEILGT